VFIIACDSMANVPGTKPIRRAAMTVDVLVKWRVRRSIGVRWGMRSVRSMNCFR
jgi:hypothetical protein